MIVVEHDAISDPNSRQGESPFAWELGFMPRLDSPYKDVYWRNKDTIYNL
jgi:hypothetical protein